MLSRTRLRARLPRSCRVTFDKSGAGPRAPATSAQVEAYELFIKSRVSLARRVALSDAIAGFERVIELDPGHARAHASLAETLRLQAQLGGIQASTVVPRAKAALSRAQTARPWERLQGFGGRRGRDGLLLL